MGLAIYFRRSAPYMWHRNDRCYCDNFPPKGPNRWGDAVCYLGNSNTKDALVQVYPKTTSLMQTLRYSGSLHISLLPWYWSNVSLVAGIYRTSQTRQVALPLPSQAVIGFQILDVVNSGAIGNLKAREFFHFTNTPKIPYVVRRRSGGIAVNQILELRSTPT